MTKSVPSDGTSCFQRLGHAELGEVTFWNRIDLKPVLPYLYYNNWCKHIQYKTWPIALLCMQPGPGYALCICAN